MPSDRDTESVKAALSSSATCTSATIEELSRLLDGGPAKKKTTTRSEPNGPDGESSLAQTRAKSRGRGTATSTTKVRGNTATICELNPSEKVKLATEVVNICLKTLNQAVLSAGGIKKAESQKKSSAATEPLSSRSLNLPAKTTKLPKNNDASSKENGIDNVAQCARIALGSLRKHNDQGKSQALPPLQIESAMSTLIAKLIALELIDPACKEIRILARRLGMGVSSVRGETVATKGSSAGPTISTSPLSDLLHLDCLSDSAPRLSLVFSTQVHVLRLLRFTKSIPDPFVLQKVLVPAVHGSPCSLIEALIPVDGKEKCIRLLGGLAHAISSVSDRIFSKLDSAFDPKLDAARGLLQLRILSLEILCRSWNLAGHTIDVNSQLYLPFKRHVESYLSQSKVSAEHQYEAIEFAIPEFYRITCDSTFSDQQKQDLKSASLDLDQTLYKCSLASANHKRSQELANGVNARLCAAKIPGIRKASLFCQFASMTVQNAASISKSEVCKALTEALDFYSISTDGTSQDLDDLLASVSNLRKAAMNSLKESLLRQSAQERDPDTFCLLRDSVLKTPTFILNYLGRPTKQQNTGAVNTRYEKRKSLASKVGRATIESVVTLARLDTHVTSKEWSLYERSLKDCLSLQERLSIDDADDSMNSSKRQTPVSVLISNAYWSRYMTLRQGPKNTTEMSTILDGAVRLLQHLPIEHQELGLFPYKLERLAYSQEQNKDWRKASDTYRRVFDHLRQSGLVETIGEKLLWIPRLTSLLENDKLKLVGKAVDGFCRTAIHLDDQDMLTFCPVDLPPDVQGLILELLLVSLQKNSEQKGDSMQTTIEQLGQKILGIYTDDQFPIRRLRAVASLAQCGVFTDTERQAIEANETLEGNERLLLPFHDHLIARHNAILGMKLLTDSKLLSTALKQWIKLVSGKAATSRKALEQRIDDLEEWRSLLSTVVDYADAHGLTEQRIYALDLLVYTNNLAMNLDSDAFVLHTSSLAMELIDMDFKTEAQSLLVLSKAQLPNVANLEFSTYHWQMAQANFEISTGNDNTVEDLLSLAKVNLDTVNKHGSRSRSIDTLRKEAQYNSIRAKHFFDQGNHKKATYHIKRSLGLLLQAWTITERRYDKLAGKNEDVVEEQDNSSLEAMTDPENSTVVNESNSYNDKRKSSKFWILARPLFETLVTAVNISSHAGLISESRYYVQEAIRIVDSIPAPALKVRALLVHSIIENMSGDSVVGRGLYEKARTLLESCRSLESIQTALLDAERAICLSFYDVDDIEDDLDKTYRLVNELQSPKLLSLQSQASNMTGIEGRLANLEISTTRRAKPMNSVPKSGKIPKKSAPNNIATSSTTICHSDEASRHNQLKRRLLLAKAQILADKQQFSDVVAVQEQIAKIPEECLSNLQQAIITTKLHLEQGLTLLESDPVLNIVPEATLSHPSAVSSALPTKAVKSSRVAKKDNLKSDPRKEQAGEPEHFAHLSQALEDIEAAQIPLIGRPSALQGHQIADLRLKGHLALGAVVPSTEDTEHMTDFLIQHLEHGRNYACLLGNAAVQAEKLLRSNTSEQSSLDSADDFNIGSSYDAQQFRSDYIDIIPSDWNVVSISLSEDRSELRIGSFASKVVPLILSIPLTRQANDGTNIDFTFDHVKKELQRIINLANFSTHEGTSLAKKGAKAEWWEARAALDSKLGDLLTNIENIWLGGFKGVLKYCTVDKDLTDNFELAFIKILDSHLPSRQAKKNRNQGLAKLDTRILELFVRLGRPSKSNDIDEPIMDLLYFVIDILWFNGEHNVCDEIDFDPIVIEVRNALTVYHEAVELNSTEAISGHTILILDKRLHSFPWESLPCMEGQSVCRLPSLQFLRQRILQMHETSDLEQSLTIDASNGAYILNPSGDLKNTLATFQSPLSTLTAWSSHINSEPSESDIATALSTKSLYVYFGHGSGGQFIRSRTIRRLDQCSVTLLMGCSSVTLTEAGEYESYGTPLNYLHAGAPAVLGTLWDVTDKDIDRLSLKMLREWGLFERDETIKSSLGPFKRNARGRGQQNRKQKEQTPDVELQSPTTLDEAVTRARSACLMRYLNGAAVVVYGIPITLQ